MAKKTILGLDPAILAALWANVLSWFVHKFAPSFLPYLTPSVAQEDTTETESSTISPNDRRTRCIIIGRPGGVEQLRVITLKPGIATCGYNLADQDIPFTKPLLRDTDIPPDCGAV